MVWFSFTFLLGIPNCDEEKLENEKKKETKLLVEQNFTEIEVSKPNFLCHIEYVLNPREAPKFIDVVCWNQAAKIYYENSTSTIIPLKLEKLRWIHFRVNHNMKLKLEDVPVFHSHNVKFTISLGNKKLGEPAKSDKPKKFYGPNLSYCQGDNFFQKQLFQPLSETLDDLPTVSYFKEHLTPQQQLYITLDTSLETNEHYKKIMKTLVALTKEYHDETFVRYPTPPYEEFPPLVNILGQNTAREPAGSKKGKDKKLDKKSAAKNKEAEKMEFSITGDEFLSGKKNFEKCLKYNADELPYVFCLGAAKNVLSLGQASLYKPLSIVISSLNYLPVDHLKNCGVTKIKFRFMICNNLLAESNLIPIDTRMKINHARTIFSYLIDKEEIIYFIQTGGLHIELLGNLEKTQPGPENTQKSSNFSNEREEEFVTLGNVFADISSILLQPHRVRLKCNLQMSRSYYDVSSKKENAFTSTNEFNSCQETRRGKYDVNYLAGTGISSPVLTLTAGLGHPLNETWQAVSMNPDLFNRLVVIFRNVDLAVPIVQMIQDEVDDILGQKNYIKNGKSVKRPLTKNHSETLINTDCTRKSRMTGFLIDCTDKIIIYAESSVFGGIQKVWAFTSYLSPNQGHVLYDSSLIFLDRLYENLFQFGGFIGITLKEPLQVILSKSQSYNSQSIPRPAWTALQCLSLLTECKSIKAATQNNLFPDFNSLVSLAIEFGLPTRVTDKR